MEVWEASQQGALVEQQVSGEESVMQINWLDYVITLGPTWIGYMYNESKFVPQGDVLAYMCLDLPAALPSRKPGTSALSV